MNKQYIDGIEVDKIPLDEMGHPTVDFLKSRGVKIESSRIINRKIPLIGKDIKSYYTETVRADEFKSSFRQHGPIACLWYREVGRENIPIRIK